MLNELEQSREIDARLGPLRVIALGLIMGVAVFALIAWSIAPVGMTPAGSPAPAGAPLTVGSTTLDTAMLMRLVWAALALSAAPALVLVRRGMINHAALRLRHAPSGERGPIDDLAEPYFRTWTLIALAIVESAAIFGCCVLMFSVNALDALLVGLPLVVMLVGLFPTAGRLRGLARAIEERAATMH